MLSDLDTRDTAILKGLAISAIVLHNFFSYLSPATANEFTFSPTGYQQFVCALGDPTQLLQAFLCFFGHFGVQVFVFLTAYGLAKSHWDDTSSWCMFMWGRIKKLYPIIGLVVFAWAFTMCDHMGPVEFFRTLGMDVVLMMLGLSTLAGYGLPPVGPWWFIPFIVQFYAMWPLLRKMTVKFGESSLLIVALLFLIFTYSTLPLFAHWSVNLLMTPVGRMPGICFGIYAARYSTCINTRRAILAFLVLIVGSQFILFWPFTFISALALTLWMYLKVRGTLRKHIIFKKLGDYSLIVFLVNGVVGSQFLVYAVTPLLGIVFGCITVVVSFLIAAAIQDYLLPHSCSPQDLRHA
jgi:hypothetical protein